MMVDREQLSRDGFFYMDWSFEATKPILQHAWLEFCLMMDWERRLLTGYSEAFSHPCAYEELRSLQ